MQKVQKFLPFVYSVLFMSLMAGLTYLFPLIPWMFVGILLVSFFLGFRVSLVSEVLIFFGFIWYKPFDTILFVSISTILSYFISRFRELRNLLLLEKQKYETVITAAPDIILTTDSRGRIVFASPRVFGLLGYSSEELQGKNIEILMPPNEKEAHNEHFERYIKSGKRTFDWAGHQIPVQRKDGKIVLMEISLGEYTVQGKQYFTGILRDVSEREKLQQEIKESEERFRIQFKSAPVPIYTWQRQGDDFVMIDYNDATLSMTQGKPSVLLGKKASIAYKDNPEIIGYMNDAYENKSIVRESGIYKMRTTGEERYLNATFAYVPDDLLLIHTEDVTDQHYAHEKLKESIAVAQEASAAKDQFLAILSHELRTPMASILGYSNLLASKRLPEVEQEKALKAIEHSAKVQVSLINDLLDVSRITSGKILIKDLIVGVPGLVKQLATTMRTQVNDKHLTLVENISNEALFVKGDPERLQQALMNIVDNAVKFTDKGSITLSVERRGLSVDIIVKDTGIGITKELMPRLFQKFLQGEVAMRRRYKGLGLGLFIAKSIVDLHHGIIRAESEVGVGTTITISLPLMSPPLEETITTLPVEIQDDLSSIKVLVIDDDMDTLDMLVLSLRKYGATVFPADSAEKGLTIINENEIDVIISDVGMAVMDGLMFMEKLRSMGNKTPSIALTAFEGLQYEIEAKGKGFNGFLSKPVSLENLVREILQVHVNYIK